MCSAHHVGRGAPFGLTHQVAVRSVGAQPLIVGGDDGVSAVDPALHRLVHDLQVVVGRMAFSVARGRTDVGDTSRAVQPGDHRPAALRGRTTRDGDGARDRDRLALRCDGAVEDQPVAGTVVRRVAFECASPDHAAVGAVEEALRGAIEGVVRLDGAHGVRARHCLVRSGLGGRRGGDRGEQRREDCTSDKEPLHGAPCLLHR